MLPGRVATVPHEDMTGCAPPPGPSATFIISCISQSLLWCLCIQSMTWVVMYSPYSSEWMQGSLSIYLQQGDNMINAQNSSSIPSVSSSWACVDDWGLCFYSLKTAKPNTTSRKTSSGHQRWWHYLSNRHLPCENMMCSTKFFQTILCQCDQSYPFWIFSCPTWSFLCYCVYLDGFFLV